MTNIFIIRIIILLHLILPVLNILIRDNYFNIYLEITWKTSCTY